MEELKLIQFSEDKIKEKLRFPFLINNPYIKNDFIQKFTYSEFETPFRHNINHSFLDPDQSILDEWIFDSIPYQNDSNITYDKSDIPCFSATRFASGRASAMKLHILPLVEKHNSKLFNVNFANKILNQNIQI
jgi:hypothetical protein